MSTLDLTRSSSSVARTTFKMTELVLILDKISITDLNAQSSPLLRLPAELRNKIYERVLGNHDIILRSKRNFQIRESSHKPTLTGEEKKAFLNLTLVSRQIYTETAMVPFASNTFVLKFDSETSEKALAQNFLPAQANSIATIKCLPGTLFYEFCKGPVASRHCLQTFADLEGLKRLILTIDHTHLTDEEKSCMTEKIREAHGKKELEVVFTSETLVDTWYARPG